jgi:tRNA pseudouridine55 synthase
MNSRDGVLIINKPGGITSHDVVMQVRRITGERRIGHTGTLDPLATGVLVLCIGRATRIARYLEADDKEYAAVMKLGVSTDTLDADGRTLHTASYVPPSLDTLLKAMNSFVGEILQTPPAFSAVKIKGTPAYKLARKGTAPALLPRLVTVHGIRLDAYDDPYVRLSVRCSKGLYVRSLCADLGNALGMGAHLAGLERIRSGRFSIDKALSLEAVSRMAQEGRLSSVLMPMNDALSHFPGIVVSTEDAQRIVHGNRIPWTADASLDSKTPVRIQSGDGSLLAVAKVTEGELRPELVFS